ncbi:sensor histidine kinase [Homoserinibacter sp. GY 40078]|uniref:sensor histidine kinase n=1 Tax=Homoserinibacter sp. GY 40078 TaxID=2603275 RepID=UPI0011C8CECD|nr:histidine kinase [Homoserinibacter sp. GY 40078]TXK17174.1 sensor histidine kinase [Homoserinibacter sp. GY 40078]
MWRPIATFQLVVDILIASGYFVFFGLLAYRGYVVDLIVIAGFAASLALRRKAPGFALGIAWCAAILQMVLRIDPGPLDVAVFPIVYTAAAYGTSLVRWLALASSIVAPATITGYIIITQGWDSLSMCLQFQYSSCASYVPGLAGRAVGWFVAFTFAFLLAWTIGQLVRTRVRARASRAAALAAETEIVAEQERTRIARDMHDVVAHSLAVVVAQADGARYAAASDPETANEALRTIAATAREALADVRVLLAQLRYQQDDGPQPTLGDLDRLLDQLRSSGLRIVREDSGAPLPLGATMQLAVYRIVQESLTNVLRHADASRDVGLRFAWSSHGLELQVSSALRDARPRTGLIQVPGSAGHGIAGMTERAALSGGWLRAAPQGDRFIVTAWLPYAPTASHPPITVPVAPKDPA